MSDELFNEFWRTYPKKVSKLDAIKAWKQMTREYKPEDIIDGLRRNLPTLQAKDRQFIKHPASWLRAGCWLDEPEPQSTGNYYLDSLLIGSSH